MAWTIISPGEQASVVEGIRDGDPSAEEAFVRLFGERVRIMMLARTRDRETARELTQDVMLAAWRAIREGQLRDPERLAAFVHGVARNVANSHARARMGEPPIATLTPAVEIAAEPRDERTADRRALVAKALRLLADSDRQVLLLTLVDGLKPREIAKRLRLGVDVIRTRKSRALKRLIDIVEAWSRSPEDTH